VKSAGGCEFLRAFVGSISNARSCVRTRLLAAATHGSVGGGWFLGEDFGHELVCGAAGRPSPQLPSGFLLIFPSLLRSLGIRENVGPPLQVVASIILR